MWALNSTYLLLVGILVAIVLAPALLAGGGFVLAVLAALLVVIVLIGGPEAARMLWQRHIARSQGEKAGANFRDFVGGTYEDPDQPRGGDSK